MDVFALQRDARLAGLDVRSHAVWRRRVAQGWADQGLRLSEAAGRVRAGPRSDRATQRTPERSAGGDDFGRLFFGDFFWRSKRSWSPAGATTRPGMPETSASAEEPTSKIDLQRSHYLRRQL